MKTKGSAYQERMINSSIATATIMYLTASTRWLRGSS